MLPTLRDFTYVCRGPERHSCVSGWMIVVAQEWLLPPSGTPMTGGPTDVKGGSRGPSETSPSLDHYSPTINMAAAYLPYKEAGLSLKLRNFFS